MRVFRPIVHPPPDFLGSYLQRNPCFSNPRFFCFRLLFPSSQSNAVIEPAIAQLSDFSNQVSFPLEAQEIGIPLYFLIKRAFSKFLGQQTAFSINSLPQVNPITLQQHLACAQRVDEKPCFVSFICVGSLL